MNIQAKIRQQGFTVAQVAAKMKKKSGGIGISQGSLSTILNGNPTIDKLKEIADIIGLTLSELVEEDEDSCTQSITCPHCGKKIRVSLFIERDKHCHLNHNLLEVQSKHNSLHLNRDDGTIYHFKKPRTQEERTAMLELQTSKGEDGMVNVRNIITGEVDDIDYHLIEPMK